MKKHLPRDTPVDSPAVKSPGALFESAELGPDVAMLGTQALERARSVETLEMAYAAWMELKEAHAAAQRRWREERGRLSEQGQLLLGAVKGVELDRGRSAGEAELSTGDALGGFRLEAEAKLAAALQQLEGRSRVEQQLFISELGKLQRELLQRVARQAAAVPPRFRLVLQVLSGQKRVLQAQRLGPDESVIALYVLTGRIPSRYGFLFDDSTDDAQALPPMLYADEGLGVGELRPSLFELGSSLSSRAEVWPVKGMLPVVLPGGSWARWISRGAVMEAEVQDGEGFRNLLTEGEAERMTGLLLSHKLAGRVEMELGRG